MQYINYETVDENIAVLTFNRPEAANALSLDLLTELENSIQQIRASEKIRCVIITGNGEKAFCAGADLKERRTMSDTEVVSAVQKIGSVCDSIEKIDVPVIAAINGVAFGGGLELALACDLRIAANHVKLGLTETSLAIIPGAGGTQRLPRLIGIGQAKLLIYTAKTVSAEDALALGLIERSVAATFLRDEAISIARKITKNGPIAVKQAKKAINQGINLPLDKAIQLEHESYLKVIPTKDRKEGLQAFQEKRKPDYRGN
ncbi:enoyl-CoA hydratase [Oceanobacillus neutriphilus]|uniref:Enoyl-CoA hydratase n=1 Tax=Oceanobacillus neutriphilus TaxID=531815 RepID=A0ABQ2P1Z5_9BACI|nr:enoyl-CoA hydratase [Oceanobacillus neutriphilus]GGP15985.1 enoyl-CoA hydratase [Oceanobacillus neutriphilus]